MATKRSGILPGEKRLLIAILHELEREFPKHVFGACDTLSMSVAAAARALGLPAYYVSGEASYHDGDEWVSDFHAWVVLNRGNVLTAHLSKNIFDPKLEYFRDEWRRRQKVEPFYKNYVGEEPAERFTLEEFPEAKRVVQRLRDRAVDGLDDLGDCRWCSPRVRA
jgi:hypothetical protein